MRRMNFYQTGYLVYQESCAACARSEGFRKNKFQPIIVLPSKTRDI